MKNTARIVSATLVLAALAGCGAKGPLFMPEEAAPIELPDEAPADADENTGDRSLNGTDSSEDAEPAEAGSQQAQPPATP